MSKGTIGTSMHIVRIGGGRRNRYYCGAPTLFGSRCTNLVDRRGEVCEFHRPQKRNG